MNVVDQLPDKSTAKQNDSTLDPSPSPGIRVPESKSLKYTTTKAKQLINLAMCQGLHKLHLI